MNLNWSKSFGDIVETAHRIVPLCEERLEILTPQQQERSRETLDRIHQQLGGNLDFIRRSPHKWGSQLAFVAIKVARRMVKRTEEERTIAAQLANFCGLVFDYLRKDDPTKNENDFRDSLEIFIKASLPQLVITAISADLVDEVKEFLNRFYNNKIPRDLTFLINDTILQEYEARRRTLDTPEQHGLMVRFVEVNRDLISLPVSEASEYVRERWQDLYTKHVGEPPPSPEPKVVNSEIRANLKKAVLTNDPLAVRDVLAPLETGLIHIVKKALDVSFDVREPRRAIRDYSRNATADFEAARRQVRSNSKQALRKFSDIWKSQTENYVAMEWYAYARAKLENSWRQAKDLFEQVREAHRGDQITDWNIACCEIRLGDRETAFKILSERVESGKNIGDVLEPTIDLALDLKEKRFLSQHLDWVPLEEAILLGYLFAADSKLPSEELEEWLPAVEVIASEPRGFELPDPAERLSFKDATDLRFAFIQRRMVRGGITWFRRRVDFQEHKYFYLNWRLLGDLCIQASLFDEAVTAYNKALDCTNRAQTPQDVKHKAIETVLNVLLEHHLDEAAKNIFTTFGSMVPPAAVKRWQQRLPLGVEPERDEKVSPIDKFPEPEKEEPLPLTANPQTRLEQITNRLLKIKRLEELKGDFTPLSQAVDLLFDLWPAYSRILVEHLRSVVEVLRTFDQSSNLDEKEGLGKILREKLEVANSDVEQISEPELKEKAGDIVTTLKRLAAQASFQTSVMREIELDWHLNSYLPDKTLEPVSPDLPKAAILLRIFNRGAEKINAADVYLDSESEKIGISGNIQHLKEPLEIGTSAVFRFPLDYDSVSGEVAFLAYAKFSAGGVIDLKTPPTRFVLKAESFSKHLNGQDRILDSYFTGWGIPEDRRDVFHGREREQKRIADSLRGKTQSEVLFLNGPRRVGKTSILNSLKWALPELGLNDIIPVSLGEEIPASTASFLRVIAAEISKAVDAHLNVQGYVQIPTLDEFEREPIVAFRNFCDVAQQRLTPRRILLMLDETQRLAEAVKSGRLDDNVFGIFSTLIARNSGIMFLFTASVVFRNVKDLSPHPIWGRLAPYATGFLNADAVRQVLEAGVASYPVKFTDEAVNRVWQMTEGHPWIVQAIGKRIVNNVLNPQQRLAVSPSDVDQAVEFIEKTEDQFTYYWWNEVKEEGGFIDESDWEVARTILEEQLKPGSGIPKTSLLKATKHRGLTINNERINKLVEMQTMVKESRNGEEYVRIKGLFLERWLKDQVDTRHLVVGRSSEPALSVALFVDHENVKISMEEFVKQLSPNQEAAWSSVRDPVLLARRLAQNAERFGSLVSRIAVANWQLFVQDLPAYAQAMFSFDQPLGGKNTSDEKLKQLIRDTLEQRPEVSTYVIATGDADFRDTILTLLKRNKHVILWGFRAVGALKSNMSGIFHEMETWQNVTIEYLDDILLKEPSPKQFAAT
ncbi:MAG TPA: NYN domain-containing protein [Pyrinomonadaceae bacterium]|jgi:tetratricopeptide (TPR) repeat protein